MKVLAVVDAEEKARLAREEASKAARETQAPAPAPSAADVGRGEPSPGADVGCVSPVLAPTWAGVSRVPGADVGGCEPSPTVPVQMWAGVSPVPLSLRRCGPG